MSFLKEGDLSGLSGSDLDEKENLYVNMSENPTLSMAAMEEMVKRLLAEIESGAIRGTPEADLRSILQNREKISGDIPEPLLTLLEGRLRMALRRHSLKRESSSHVVLQATSRLIVDFLLDRFELGEIYEVMDSLTVTDGSRLGKIAEVEGLADRMLKHLAFISKGREEILLPLTRTDLWKTDEVFYKHLKKSGKGRVLGRLAMHGEPEKTKELFRSLYSSHYQAGEIERFIGEVDDVRKKELVEIVPELLGHENRNVRVEAAQLVALKEAGPRQKGR